MQAKAKMGTGTSVALTSAGGLRVKEKEVQMFIWKTRIVLLIKN
jgi:hypothetical protein